MLTLPSLDISSLRQAYLAGEFSPLELIRALIKHLESDTTNNIWISRLTNESLEDYARALDKCAPGSLPLYGIPFAIKDNIDLAGLPTTAGCPDYAYVPDKHAFVVQQLIEAGAIPLGKTNLDQFATGLNGTRSPYGVCKNSFDPAYVSGGSSSGSAVAVALGYCSFALGTDTAGSGRVPAAFNNLVGHKPSCGWLSSSGVVPACRSIDTISVFALTAEDAETVMTVAARFDPTDGFARVAEAHGFDFGRAQHFRIGIPHASTLQFFGNTEAQRLFGEAVAHLQALGGEVVEIDLTPFLDTARLLYEGPWVAERYAAIREFFDAKPEATLPAIQTIIGGAKKWSAADAYAYGYKLKDQKRICDSVWQGKNGVDCIVTPTAGTIYAIEEMQTEPIKNNSNLGYYTNFMNLLDYAATAVPAGFQADGLPFGVTLFAPAHQDGPLLHLASRLQHRTVSTVGALAQRLPDVATDSAPPQQLSSGMIKLAVCGAHMSGLPLNWQLTERGAHFIAATYSAPEYQLYALPGGPPHRPGMVRVKQGGISIALEVWELPLAHYGSFVAGIPAPLGIGTVRLLDGSAVQGFVCESVATAEATDISHLGSWRRYLEQQH